MMTGGETAVRRRTYQAGGIMGMLVILMFPFLGMQEIGEDKAA